MRHFLITFHETDGNDCTVYDAIIEANTEEQALSILSYNIERSLDDNKTPYSDDGSELGYYFDCFDDCHEECEGHGGIALRTVESYETRKEAESEASKFHCTYVCDNGATIKEPDYLTIL